MSTIVTRAGKGSALTHTEVDANFTNLNTDKIQSGNTVAALTITSATIAGGTITGITDLAVADGGTGASDASGARTNLGLGTIATQASSNVSITGGAINGTTVGATTPSTGSFTSLTDSGNLTFTGTGNRIIGDFSNATVANRVAFQTSTTNGNTGVFIVPNGTGTNSNIQVISASDPTNSSTGTFQAVGGSDIRIQSGIHGTGTYLPMTFYTGGSERMRVDTSGNVGIGTSSPISLLHLESPIDTSLQITKTGQSNWLWQTLDGGVIRAFSLTATAERMRIDSSGNVGIGTSSPVAKLDVAGNIVASNMYFGTTTGSAGTLASDSGNSGGSIVLWGSTSPGAGQIEIATAANAPTIFKNNNTERARITSGGDLCVSTTGSENGNTKISVRQSGAGNNGIWSHNTSTSDGASKFVATTAVTTASSGHFFYDAAYNWTTAFSRAFAVRGDGVIFALNTTIQALSDQRLKENVVDANDGLSVITALRPVRFDWKKETGIEKTNQLGFIAQEVEQVFPDAVDTYSSHDNPDDPYKSVGAGALIPVLVKAIQEQQALITALTTRITALENK